MLQLQSPPIFTCDIGVPYDKLFEIQNSPLLVFSGGDITALSLHMYLPLGTSHSSKQYSTVSMQDIHGVVLFSKRNFLTNSPVTAII